MLKLRILFIYCVASVVVFQMSRGHIVETKKHCAKAAFSKHHVAAKDVERFTPVALNESTGAIVSAI